MRSLELSIEEPKILHNLRLSEEDVICMQVLSERQKHAISPISVNTDLCNSSYRGTTALTKTQQWSSKNIPLTLSRGCWELTIHVVDLEASQVFGCAGFGGGKQRWVVDWEVTVVVL